MAVPLVQIRLLGEFSLTYADTPVTAVRGARLQALLAYLLLHRDAPRSRQQIAYLFWPDTTESQARNNLRQLLHHLRQVWPPAARFLQSDSQTLRWRENGLWSLDVATFEQALARAAAATAVHDQATWRLALSEAVGLYQGDLLPYCDDAWIAPLRERLRQRYLGALATLARLAEGQRDYVTATQHARDWIRHDPISDEAHRTLMRLLALTTDIAGAVSVYHTYARTLQRELGVEPGPATREVYDRLLRLNARATAPAARGRRAAALPALVGRQREWERLQEIWQQASAGMPRFALLTGEAGIGKTRVAEELLTWAARQGVVVARTRAYAAEGQLVLAPVSALLRSERLRPYLARLDPVWLTEVSRILPEILTEHRDLPPPTPITEDGKRQRFFEALARAVLAAPPPFIILIDDLQWCDQETLTWLHFLLRFDPTERLLIVGTARQEELLADHPVRTFLLQVGTVVSVAEIPLQPLDVEDTARLAAQVLGQELQTDTALRLYRETEGNPLFVVETIRAGIGQALDLGPETSPHALPAPHDRAPLPPRVYTVIAGRLAQLSPSAREIAGLAAALGRNFTRDIVLHASHADDERVDQALDELWTKRIVRELDPNTYDFTHDKLREVAYSETGVPHRRRLHRRIARAYETAYADDPDTVSGQIALHYEHAGMAERAIPYYQRAAAVARRVYAHDDAIGLLTRGRALLERLPAGRTRDTQELRLLLALAPLLRVAKGWTASDLERALDRAQALCATLGDDEQLVQVLGGLQTFYTVQARFDDVQHISDRLDALGRRSQETTLRPYSRVAVSGSRLHRGELTAADRGFAELIAAADPDQVQRVQDAHGLNYLVHAQAWHAHALWCLGYPQSALVLAREAVHRARALAQPINHALAAAYLAILMQLCADDAVAKAHAEEALALAGACKALYYQGWSAILVDYHRAWEQPDDEGIARLRAAIAAFTETGARLRLPYYLSLLARVYGKAGRSAAAVAVLDEALTVAAEQQELWWDAELHRLRGDVLLICQATQEGEGALLRAIQIARAQCARSLELRAATSLARLRLAQGRADEARPMLADLCAWFTEGIATPDLDAAWSLLARSV